MEDTGRHEAETLKLREWDRSAHGHHGAFEAGTKPEGWDDDQRKALQSCMESEFTSAAWG